jgi:hypothetical protein
MTTTKHSVYVTKKHETMKTMMLTYKITVFLKLAKKQTFSNKISRFEKISFFAQKFTLLCNIALT